MFPKSIRPYLLLLLCLLPLLFFPHSEQSLIAHDEGLYATRARLMLDSGNWIHPWTTPHHKTPGHYWITAISMAIFGVNETAVRLPSKILSLTSLLLLFSLGQKLLTKQAAFLATIILGCSFLWFQYSHLGGPDLLFITLNLFTLFALLQAEEWTEKRSYWQFAAGLCFSLNFLVRSLMAVLSLLALSPYLFGGNHRHRHLNSKSLYGGIMIGLIPVGIWLLAIKQGLGLAAWSSLVRFVLQLGSEERDGNGITYYLGNIVLNMFPWALFSLQGAWIVWKQYKRGSQDLVLLGAPIVLLITLSLFSTRIPHYALIIYPYLALLAGLALAELSQVSTYWDNRRIIKIINIIMLGLGGILFLGACALWFNLLPLAENIPSRLYALLAISLGLPWLLGGWDGLRHPAQVLIKSLNLALSRWIIGLLLGFWLMLIVSTQGLIGNANPDVKSFVSRPEIEQLLQTQTIYLVSLPDKMSTLLRFYTPHFVKLEELTVEAIPVPAYVWITSNNLASTQQPYRVIGTLRDLSLIEIEN